MSELSKRLENIKPLFLQKTALYKTWVEVSKKALLHNLSLYKSLTPKNYLCPVLKSNAYGHGLSLVAKIYQKKKEVDWIAVTSLNEALFLRNIGITKPLLVLSTIDEDPKQAFLNNISLVAYDLTFIKELNQLAKKYQKKAKIHIKIDTGFSRLGIFAHEAFEIIRQIKKCSHIQLEGIFSHFSDSTSDDLSFTHKQFQQFSQLLANLKKNNIHIPYVHIANTAAIPFTEFNNNITMKRLGIGTYGLWPSAEHKKNVIQRIPNFSLHPALTWKTQIIQTKLIPAHSYVGYGLTYKTNEVKKIALLPIGYWDGYDRKLSNCGTVKIAHFYAPVLGTISMNLSVIDVTHIPDTYLNYDVILLGNDTKISADILAQKIGTINYEVVTRINPLISRILVD